MAKNVLVTSDNIGEDNIRRLSKAANVFASWKMDGESLERILPDIDVLVVFMWPKFLTAESLAKMKRLRFLQSILVGVNHVPFSSLSQEVVIASNAGAYSVEVGEHAWALLLAAAKKVVEHHLRIKGGASSLREFSGEAAGIMVLEGKTLGIFGYGGIGRSVMKHAKASGMKVLAYGRGRRKEEGVKHVTGREGLELLLRECDVVLLSLPLTNSTFGLIGNEELSMMKEDSIMVNVARGDLVDQDALYFHLGGRPGFRYATDVWWYKEGQETLKTDHPFTTLPNFVGTPHMSGPTGAVTGKPGKLATDNVLLYLKGKPVMHVVDRSEYVGIG